MNTAELPLDVQERLLDLAEKLPTSSQATFLRGVTAEIGGLLKDHPRTIIFAALGWVLGEVIDHLLTFDLPLSDVVLCLTVDRASDVLAVGGGVLGFLRDRNAIAERDAVSKVVARELRKALGERNANV